MQDLLPASANVHAPTVIQRGFMPVTSAVTCFEHSLAHHPHTSTLKVM